MFPFLVPFLVRFVLSYSRFPFVSCIAFLDFLFASLLSLVADSVILLFRLGATSYTLPRAPCEPEVCVFPLRAVFFLAFLMLIYLFFLLFLPSLRLRFGQRLFHPVGTMLLFRLVATPPLVLVASLKYAHSPCVLSFFLRS